MRRLVYVAVIAFAAAGCDVHRQPVARAGDSTRGASRPSAVLAVRYDQHVFAGGIAPPADTTMRNPFAGNAAIASEGARLFNNMNCDGCHGSAGEGWVAPSLNDGRWRYGGSDGAIYQTIFGGRPHGMPAFGGLLAKDAIWRLVSYIRSMPPGKTGSTQSWP